MVASTLPTDRSASQSGMVQAQVDVKKAPAIVGEVRVRKT